MSINVSQIFVRYPDPQDAAERLADLQKKDPANPAFIVTRTPGLVPSEPSRGRVEGPWLAVAADGDSPSPAAAQALSRALEARAVWYGLAGNTLAYRLIRWSLGREEESVLEPPELSLPGDAFPLPAYRDVEGELHARLRKEGLPVDYLYLFFAEIGMAGGDAPAPDAALVRDGTVQPFTHRVPRRADETVRTQFDEFQEDERRVCEVLRLRGTFDESRAKQLFAVLETICRRRRLPEGWSLRYVAEGPPGLGERLAATHARGGYSYEFTPGGP